MVDNCRAAIQQFSCANHSIVVSVDPQSAFRSMITIFPELIIDLSKATDHVSEVNPKIMELDRRRSVRNSEIRVELATTTKHNGERMVCL